MLDFIAITLVTTITLIINFILIFMFWYNGTLDVLTSADGDDLKLNINEYDMIRKKKFMIIVINRKNK